MKVRFRKWREKWLPRALAASALLGVFLGTAGSVLLATRPTLWWANLGGRFLYPSAFLLIIPVWLRLIGFFYQPLLKKLKRRIGRWWMDFFTVYKVQLVPPNTSHEEAALDYVREHRACGEATLHGACGLHTATSYSAWLESLAALKSESSAPRGKVPSHTFFGVDNEGRIVGMISIHLRLNATLKRYGGHIGYGVRPTERDRDYATAMLAQALAYCRLVVGMTRVLVTCEEGNAASARIICKNGGIADTDGIADDGTIVQRYWIDIQDL